METPSKRSPRELDRLFPDFRSLVYERGGIYFSDGNRDRLLGHVAARMRALGRSDPAQYLEQLRSCRASGGELSRFFDQVTVNETYFFREQAQFDVFRDRVLPELIRKRKEDGRARLTIWSAASSTGEEAYSLAILLKECFLPEVTTTSIIGFDLSSQAVERAVSAQYGDYSVRNCSDKQRSTYFRKVGDSHQLVPYIKRLATFQVGNLMDPSFLRALPRPDLILCRNVLIYFDRDSKSEVLKNLAGCLLPHGYLFLSQTETLMGLAHPFELVHFFKTFGFRPKH